MDQQNNTDNMAFLSRTFATERMIAASYSDYCQSVVQNFSNLLEIVSLAVGGEFTDTTLSSYGYPIDANIFLNRQTCSVYSLMMDIQDSASQDDLSDGDDLLNTPLLSIRDTWLYNTVEEVLEELNCSFHAICSEAAIAQGYKLGGDVAERITIARDFIMQKFSSGYTDFSGSLEYAIQSMKDSINVTDWISRIMKTDGLDDLSNEVIPDIEQSDAFKYSGASATSAYCWDTVGKAVASTVAVAAKVVTGAVKGILSLGKKLFKKLKKKVVEIVVNPYDLEKLDPKEEGYTVDGYHHHRTKTKTLSPGFLGTIGNKVRLKEWYHTDWFCSEVMSRITDVYSQLVYSGDSDEWENATCKECLQRLMWCVYDGNFTPSPTDTIESLATTLLNTRHQLHPYSFNFPSNLSSNRKAQNLLVLNIFSMLLGNYCSLDYIHSAISTNTPEMRNDTFIIQFISDLLGKIMKVVNNSAKSNGIWSTSWGAPNFERVINNMSLLSFEPFYQNMSYYCGFALGTTSYDIEELVRYKPISYRFAQLLDISIMSNNWSFDMYKTIKVFKDIIDDADPYADVSDPEWYLFNSFQLGKLCHQLLSIMLFQESLAEIDGTSLELYDYENHIRENDQFLLPLRYFITNGESYSYISASTWGNIVQTRNLIPNLVSYTNLSGLSQYDYQFFSDIPTFVNATTTVSNKQFFNCATGQYALTTGYYKINISTTNMQEYVMDSILYNLYMQWKYPFSYPYWPYSKSLVEWFDPSFRIKTDQENISAFNTFVTVAVVVVAVVVAGGVTCTLLKRAAMKASLTEKGLAAQFAQKAAGGTLTKADLKTYKKAVKKANRLGKLSGNLNVPASSVATHAINLSNNNEEAINNVSNTVVGDIDSSVEQVLSLIRG